MSATGKPLPVFKRAFPAEMDAMHACIDGARAWLEERDAAPRVVYGAELAIEELVTNIIRHGRPEAGGVRVSLMPEAEGVLLTIEDSGPEFDPTRAPEPEMPPSVADAEPGGLGLRMIRRMSRRMEYERAGDQNVVRVWLAE